MSLWPLCRVWKTTALLCARLQYTETGQEEEEEDRFQIPTTVRILTLMNLLLLIHTLYIPDYQKRWTCCSIVTGIPLYFILFMRVHKMSLNSDFSESRITSHMRSSQIYLNDTYHKFISTYAFFVSIVTITKKRDC